MKERNDVSATFPLPSRTAVCDTFAKRLRGLMFRRTPLAPDEAAWLEPCDSIHTFFMKFPIDVLFLDRDGVVLAAYEQVRPWRIVPSVRGARVALELPAGAIESGAIRVGMRVSR